MERKSGATCASPKRYSFQNTFRVRKRKHFTALQQSGTRIYVGPVCFLWKQNNLAHARLGITISSKIAKHAVDRNRFKRVVREVFRTLLLVREEPLDIVVIARRGGEELFTPQMASQIEKGLQLVRKACAAEDRKK